ncbi:hypothetical protein CLOM_g9338 [Closterium sp. NIES-68]|nr:hypothetical protein CLOM_g9338 [Closterium sp. NIES-68]GJP65817.1 hypothetical protein CLOP_g22732 [Closterium sp. NIES-67]
MGARSGGSGNERRGTAMGGGRGAGYASSGDGWPGGGERGGEGDWSGEEVRRRVKGMWRHAQLLQAVLHERHHLPAAPHAAAPCAAQQAAPHALPQAAVPQLPVRAPAPPHAMLRSAALPPAAQVTARPAAKTAAEAAARAALEAEAVWAAAGERLGEELVQLMQPLARLQEMLGEGRQDEGGGRGEEREASGGRAERGRGGGEEGDREEAGEGYEGMRGWGWVERVEMLRVVRARGRAVRKKRWRGRRRAQQAAACKQCEEQRSAVEARIDAWRGRVMARDARETQARQQQREEEAREKRERAQLQKQVDALLLLERLRELRRLRVVKARRQGLALAGEDDGFMQAVRAAVEEEDRRGGAWEDDRGGGAKEDDGGGAAEEEERGRGVDLEDKREGVGEERRGGGCGTVVGQGAEDGRGDVGWMDVAVAGKEQQGKGGEGKERQGKGGEGKERQGKGGEGKERQGKGSEGKERQGKGGEGVNGSEERQGKEGVGPPHSTHLQLLHSRLTYASAAGPRLPLYELVAVRRQWDAFLLPSPAHLPSPQLQRPQVSPVPRAPPAAQTPQCPHIPPLRALTSSIQGAFFASAAPPAAANAGVASASATHSVATHDAHLTTSHLPGTHDTSSPVPPCWVRAPRPSNSEWGLYLVKN